MALIAYKKSMNGNEGDNHVNTYVVRNLSTPYSVWWLNVN